jgi:hypothetical protein
MVGAMTEPSGFFLRLFNMNRVGKLHRFLINLAPMGKKRRIKRIGDAKIIPMSEITRAACRMLVVRDVRAADPTTYPHCLAIQLSKTLACEKVVEALQITYNRRRIFTQAPL